MFDMLPKFINHLKILFNVEWVIKKGNMHDEDLKQSSSAQNLKHSLFKSV